MSLPRTPQAGTWATNDAETATKLNADAGGIAALGENTGNQGSITTDTVVTMTPSTNTWTAVAGRVYKHTVTLAVTVSAPTSFIIKIVDGSLTELYRFSMHVASSGTSDTIAFSWFERGITAASITRKLTATVGTGTGGIQGATAASQFATEDDGPA